MIKIHSHPNLLACVFVSEFPNAISKMEIPDSFSESLEKSFDAPIIRREDIRQDVRNLIRHNGYKPTGRGKPASEYLIKMGTEKGLRSINLPVDACNAVSFHSGLPISVVDLDKAEAPFEIYCAHPDSMYVFNPSGQEIDISGLLCLHDSIGPCANAVKDCQRTKTDDNTRRTLSVIWGLESERSHTLAAEKWYHSLIQESGGTISSLS